MSDDPDQFAAVLGKPSHQGTVDWITLARGPRSVCEQAIAKMRHPAGQGPEHNPGKLDIIPLARWQELKAQRLIR